jgi:LmbE family N-acetylglucosaminyl deacetylase
MDAVNTRRVIDGDGCAESVWRDWLSAISVPPLPLEDWLPATARLVVVAPHPDDEVLACGALLAMHAARHGECCVVAVTDGEASHPGSTLWSPKKLAAVRGAERVEGLRRLGLCGVRVHGVGLPDGAVHAQRAQLQQRLNDVLQPADVVVATWSQDGHPDHDACGTAAQQACAAVGCCLLTAPVWMWHWATPGDVRVPWHRLRALPADSTAWNRKQAALQAHASQRAAREGGQGPVLGAEILARAARQCEYFFV